jgi:hypothetical protein
LGQALTQFGALLGCPFGILIDKLECCFDLLWFEICQQQSARNG